MKKTAVKDFIRHLHAIQDFQPIAGNSFPSFTVNAKRPVLVQRFIAAGTQNYEQQ